MDPFRVVHLAADDLDLSWPTDDEYVAGEVRWMISQDVIQAYGYPKKSVGKKLMNRVISTPRM